MPRRLLPVWLALLLLPALPALSADWPMWRANPGRTATVTDELPASLSVLWSRELAPLKPAFRDVRLQFDRGHEPIVLGQRLFVASSRDDSLAAYDTNTGAELWKIFADGPIRFAPVAADHRVIFGSDDGILRCVAADTGKLLWQKRAVPNHRQLLGNGRLISVWPVRGGPVLHQGRVYFAAGVWPLEGVFIYCLDAATGRTIWLNDRTGYLYGIHPHQAQAFGGVAPQGYLLIDGDDLVVPCSSAYPARFDLATGTLKEFALPSAGRLPGGWFAATPEEKETQKLKRRGLLFDNAVNLNRHEDKPRAEGTAGIRRSLRTAAREWLFDQPLPGVTGAIHSLIAADQKLFAVTEEGILFALAATAAQPIAPKHWDRPRVPTQPAPDTSAAILAAAGAERGHAIVIGPVDLALLEALASKSHFQILALAPENSDLAPARQRLAAARLHGQPVALRAVTPAAAGLPPYLASVVTFSPQATLPDVATLQTIYDWLRPFGGRLIGPAALLETARAAALPQAQIRSHPDGLAVITRAGPLPGTANYLGDWSPSNDSLVKAPVGVLWFDDTLGNFKRSPQPKLVDGVMITTDKNWLDASNRKGKVDYQLQPAVFSDVYTGRVLDPYEASALRQQFGSVDTRAIQPAQYRPPTQKNDWSPPPPVVGLRNNPLTGEREPRAFPKSYGCDGGFDYGSIYTMRSGTAAFYDKRVDSGTIHISGPRSGCTSSIIPANGVLNVPYFFEGCSCSYPLPMALALVSLPQTFEQWAAWGKTPATNLTGKIERLGLNFGAPGDRRTDGGTLWIGYPAVGGPSPEISVHTEPAQPQFYYHHSVWIEGGEGWPWVAASGVRGLQSATVSGLKNGRYTVRLFFAEPDPAATAESRRFHVRLQDQPALENFSILASAGGPLRALTKTLSATVPDHSLTISLTPLHGQPLLSGLEIIRESLPVEPLPSPARVPGRL